MSTIETIVLSFSLCPPTWENYKISQQNIMSTEARFLSPCQATNYIALHCIVEVPVPVCGLAKYCIIFASVNTRSNPRSLAHNSPTPNSKLPHLGPFPHLSLPLIASLDLALTFKLPSFSHSIRISAKFPMSKPKKPQSPSNNPLRPHTLKQEQPLLPRFPSRCIGYGPINKQDLRIWRALL